MSSDYYSIKHKDKSFGFIRTDSGRWFDIRDRPILTDGKIPNRDGVVHDAVRFTNEEVAEYVAESEERHRLVESVETLLQERIDVRRARLRYAKQRLSLPKKEIAK